MHLPEKHAGGECDKGDELDWGISNCVKTPVSGFESDLNLESWLKSHLDLDLCHCRFSMILYRFELVIQQNPHQTHLLNK